MSILSILSILWPFEVILWSFGIFCGHLYIFPRFGTLSQEKSGNPGPDHQVSSLPAKVGAYGP
jgi:hypothetical protein